APKAEVEPKVEAAPKAEVEPKVEAAPKAEVEPKVEAAPKAETASKAEAAPKAEALNNEILGSSSRLPVNINNSNNSEKNSKSVDLERTGGSSATGKLVNDDITFTDLEIPDNQFDANQAGGTRLKGNFSIENSKINPGDYFNIKLPKYLNIYGNGDRSKITPPDLSFDNKVIASGTYDDESHEIKYTFSENIQDLNNVKGKINLAVFADRKNAPNSNNYAMHVDAAGETLDKNVKIDYHTVRNLLTPLANIESFIESSNKDSYKQYVYVNPKQSKIGHAYVAISDMIPQYNGRHGRDVSSAKLNSIDDIKILKVNTDQPMNESFYVNEDLYQDVTQEFKNNNLIDFYNGNDKSGKIGIDFKNLLANGERYIIRVNGENINNEDAPETRVMMESYDRYGVNRSTYYWDNENYKTDSSSDISGDNNDYEVGDYVWEDSNKDGIQNKEEKGISGVNVVLKDKDGKEINRVQTNSDGKYLFQNVKNGTYTIEFETPSGYEATKQNVGGNVELDSDGNQVTVNVAGANNYTIDSGFVKTQVEPPKPGVPNTP
ncbi:fibrinogen-binding adhesin SdrG C-terminal domain-containing protein, partial [Staphylococcus aureus]|uniref:SdrD B-like domain-containing protein n=1 Tax=Staphylococcus aureus TaxID=1280 RepID=UPI0018EC60D4